MFDFLLTIYFFFFIFTVNSFVNPKKTLFFIKDTARRKRVPYSIMILVCCVALGGVLIHIYNERTERLIEEEVNVMRRESVENVRVNSKQIMQEYLDSIALERAKEVADSLAAVR